MFVVCFVVYGVCLLFICMIGCGFLLVGNSVACIDAVTCGFVAYSLFIFVVICFVLLLVVWWVYFTECCNAGFVCGYCVCGTFLVLFSFGGCG